MVLVDYGQLTEEEIEELISYLHVKVAGAMKPLLKGNANFKKTTTTLERTQMTGSKRRRSSALLAASLTEGSAAFFESVGGSLDGSRDPVSASGDHMQQHQLLQQQQHQYERLMDGPKLTAKRSEAEDATGDGSSDDDSVDCLLASFEDPRGGVAGAGVGSAAVGNSRLDKPKYVKTSWTPAEDELLKAMFAKFREKPQKWKVISTEFNKVTQEGSFKDETQCERRWRNMPFTAQDDAMILELAHTVGVDGVTWKEVAKNILGHSGTQCQERWIKLSSNAQAASHHQQQHHAGHIPSVSGVEIPVSGVENEAAGEDTLALGAAGGELQEAAIEVIPDAVAAGVGKFKKAKLTATKLTAAATSEDAEKGKAKAK